MKIHTCQFVLSSDVFAGCQLAYDHFCEVVNDCSWGDNNRTMVAPQRIIDELESNPYYGDSIPDDDLEEMEIEQPDATQVNEEISLMIERLKSLPPDVYVDLEN